MLRGSVEEGEAVIEPKDLVFVVDDDPSACAAIEGLLRSAGFSASSFRSARDFLGKQPSDGAACLILGVGLPDISGLELQRELAVRALPLPIIFISAHGDIPTTSVPAIKAGAVGFLLKPFCDHDLFEAVREALDSAHQARRAGSSLAELRARHASLTPRQRQVLDHVVAGLLNKQIAYELGIAETTVKIHRGQVMRKMHAKSVADLVRMAESVGVLRSSL